MSTPDATTENPQVTNPDGEAAKKEKKVVKPRPYLVTSKATLDLNQDPAVVVAALEALAQDSSQVEVIVIVGKPDGLNPRAAVTALGETLDLEGDYDVVAANAFTIVPDVLIGQKRVVQVGKPAKPSKD